MACAAEGGAFGGGSLGMKKKIRATLLTRKAEPTRKPVSMSA
jgi:hypothetical protein